MVVDYVRTASIILLVNLLNLYTFSTEVLLQSQEKLYSSTFQAHCAKTLLQMQSASFSHSRKRRLLKQGGRFPAGSCKRATATCYLCSRSIAINHHTTPHSNSSQSSHMKCAGLSAKDFLRWKCNVTRTDNMWVRTKCVSGISFHST